MGVPTEALVAAVAVLTVSNAPMLAARVWGAADHVFLHSPDSPDRVLGERLILVARRAVDPVAFEIARRSGATSALEVLVDEVLAHLDAWGMPPRKLDRLRLPHGTLTQRELEVLALVGTGKTNDEIAAVLFISPKTVSVHASNAKAKIGVETRLEVALWARERGLVHDTRDF
jgi:DNA-binding NarL/FixJ family response regulator